MKPYPYNTSYLILFLLLVGQTASAFQLETVNITRDVYALIGETGPRTYENQALNNNVGFIVASDGVILIDSGASPSAAKRIEEKISEVTEKPVKWVINLGSQDHRWLGNSYFKDKGAEVIALNSTVKEQMKHVDDHLDRLKNVLKENFDEIKPVYASRVFQEESNTLELGGKRLQLRFLGDSHFPGDGVIWLADERIIFTGDLVYVDRMLGIHPYSPVTSWSQAFNNMLKLNPEYVVPGHGAVCDVKKAKSETGDYLEFLITGVSKALKDWLELDETVNALTESATQFTHLKNYDSWHKLNINRTYLQLEAAE